MVSVSVQIQMAMSFSSIWLVIAARKFAFIHHVFYHCVKHFSRVHIVSQFNEGVYDIIIASDETFLEDPGPLDRPGKRKRSVNRMMFCFLC